MIYQPLQTIIKQELSLVDQIPAERKILLEKIGSYVLKQVTMDQPSMLVYICTHNSRRSHLGQIWGKVAATYFGIPQVLTYSGGTESTAFHSNAIQALRTQGFDIKGDIAIQNPKYTVTFGDNDEHVICFSKEYNHPSNPSTGYCAIMTCAEADENCPVVSGMEARIALPYEDPKKFDNTPLQNQKYEERSLDIALENFYLFSFVSQQLG